MSLNTGTEEALDWERARRETPGCERVVHFNNAGAALPPRSTTETVLDYLRREAEIGGYETAEEFAAQRAKVYAAIGQMLGCQPGEIALMESASRAWATAFYSIPLQTGDRILTGHSEYASNYIALLHRAEQTGAQIEVIPDTPHGQIDLDALQAMLDDRVRLIAITHVPTNSGRMEPVQEIGKIARNAGVLYLLDACQSAGQMPLDVRAIGCDMLSATGRKYLRAPRGTGFLYVRRELSEQLTPVMLDLHSGQWVERDRYTIRQDARRFEFWEANIAAQLGLGHAVEYALEWGLDSIAHRVQFLANRLRQALSALPGVTVQDVGHPLCGIVTFTHSHHTPEAIRLALKARQIHVSVSARSSTRLDMERRGLENVVRASVHYYNSEAEIDFFCTTLASLA